MKKYLSKIVILIVGIFYLVAAFEVELGNSKQTWGDEYDSYVLSTNDHTDASVKIIKENYFDNYIFSCFVFSFGSSTDIFLNRDFNFIERPPQLLYLWQSVFRI